MGRPKKSEPGERLAKTVAWRVTERVHADLLRQYHESGLSQSQFLRELLERRSATIVAVRKPSKDRRDLVHQVAKIGNNINQLALSANVARKEKKIDERLYLQILKALQHIDATLTEAVDQC